jgi:hypothetical protein
MRPGRLARMISVVVAGFIGCGVLFTGCSTRDRRNSAAPRNGSAQGQPTASQGAGGCDNPYLPVSPDESLEYESSSGSNSSQGYIYSVTFTDISDGSFIEHEEVTGGTGPASYGATLDAIWKCEPEGLVSTEYADLSRPESRLKIETLNATGVAIPRADRLTKGTKWSQDYKVRGQMSFEGAPKPVDLEGTISVASEMTGQERVEVPAGVYEAVKVNSIYAQNLTLKGSPLMPINMSFTVQS